MDRSTNCDDFFSGPPSFFGCFLETSNWHKIITRGRRNILRPVLESSRSIFFENIFGGQKILTFHAFQQKTSQMAISRNRNLQLGFFHFTQVFSSDLMRDLSYVVDGVLQMKPRRSLEGGEVESILFSKLFGTYLSVYFFVPPTYPTELDVTFTIFPNLRHKFQCTCKHYPKN